MAVDVARELTVLLSVAFAGYLIAAFTRQSVVIAEILVGLLVGPSVLGLIEPSEFVEALALMGAIFLLFLVGLEHRFADIFRARYALIALAGVVLPWVGGFAFASVSGYPFVESIFIGTVLTATSIAITANVLRELGHLDSEAGRAILGAAVIDDVLGLIALAVTIQVSRGQVDLPGVTWIAGKAVAFILIGGIGGIRVIQPLLEKVDRSRVVAQHPGALFLMAMNVAFVYALVAELIGLSGIVGAFLAGVILTETSMMRGKSIKEGAEYFSTILASVFFVSLGILVDLRQVTWAIVPFIIILTIIAILTKVLGCMVPARFMGMSWRESAVVGAGMSPRGEVALIVALLALRSQVIDQSVYTSVVVMSLLTTLATPPLLRRILRGRRGFETS